MNYLGQNIKFLRKQKGLTQEKMAQKIGVGRSLIGAYEEGRAEPKLQTIMNICYYFNVNVDALLNSDFAAGDKRPMKKHVRGDKLRILPVIIDKTDELERSVIVPVKASAGYTEGYGDVDYIESLPRFQMPFPELSASRSYRLFQISGDSMLPVPSGAYIICEYIQDWNAVKNEQPYILITKNEGVVYKRIINNLSEGKLLLKSDNLNYEPYTIDVEEVLEVWRALGYTSFELPEIEVREKYSTLEGAVMKLQEDVEFLKQKIDGR